MVARLAESGREPVLPELDEHSRVVLCRALLDDIGFDFRRGRFDFSTHPFTAQLGRADVRLTMRRREGLVHSVLTVLHEGGHALYDQGFLESDAGSLLADAPSMGMHEGQARLWENHVGRGRSFWQYFASKARAVTGEVDGDTCYRAANRVGRGTIRVSADEISYHLHIIMRFELEQALVTGSLSVGDLETAFNDLSRELLGAVPQSSLDGVMQDSHWAGGMFGYFPSYTIGSLYAAQLAQAYERGHDLDGEIAHGDFSGLRRWLGENVYASGNRFTAGETIRRATGSDLDVSAFLEHLERKFGSPR